MQTLLRLALLALWCCAPLWAAPAKTKKSLPNWIESAPLHRLNSADDIGRVVEAVKKRLKACEKAICFIEETRLLKAIVSGENPKSKAAPDLKAFVLRCVKALDQYRLSLPHNPRLQGLALREVNHLQQVLANRGHVWEANQLASRLLTEVGTLALKSPEEPEAQRLRAQLLDLLGATPLSVLRAYALAYKADANDKETAQALRVKTAEFMRARCRENDIAPSLAVYFSEGSAREGYQRKMTYGSRNYFASNDPVLSSYDFYQISYLPPSTVLLETARNSSLLPILSQDNSLRSMIVTQGEDILVPPKILGAVGSHSLKLDLGKNAMTTFQRLCAKVETPKLPTAIAEIMPAEYTRGLSSTN